MIVINPRLPAGHTELTYIQSSGTQYINTGIKPTSATRCKLTFSTAGVSNVGICGSWTSATQSRFNIWAHFENPNTVSFGYGDNNGKSYKLNVPLNSVNVLEFYVESGEAVLKVNSEEVRYPVGTFTEPDLPMFLFARNQNGNPEGPATITVYGFEIYQGTTLVQNLIPDMRNIDSAVGMYDLVNDVFCTNAGTGAFVAGPKLHYVKGVAYKPGINLFNEKVRLGYFDGDGVWSTQYPIISSYNIPAKAGQKLYFYCGYSSATIGVCAFGAGDTFLGKTLNVHNDEYTCPDGCEYVVFNWNTTYGTTYRNDTCINLSDPTINGHYYPYAKAIKSIAIGDDVIWQAPASDQRTVREFIPETDPDQEIPDSEEPGIYEESVPDSSEDNEQLRIEEVEENEPTE